jgi:Domain of unknown function (DUF4160)
LKTIEQKSLTMEYPSEAIFQIPDGELLEGTLPNKQYKLVQAWMVHRDYGFKAQSLAGLDNLPDPDVLANDIIENMEAGLESFNAIIAALSKK